MQGVLLTAPLDPKLRVADGDEAGRAEAQLCFELLPLLAVAVGTGQLPSVCARACVYARARTHVLLSRPGVSEPQVGWREFGVCATPSSAAPQQFPSASGWSPQNGMRERRQATGLTSGAGKEDLAPSQNSGFGANLLILAHCHMSLGGM